MTIEIKFTFTGKTRKYTEPKVYKSTADKSFYKKYKETVKARSKQAYWDKEKKLGWLRIINYQLLNGSFCTDCSYKLRGVFCG